MFQKIDERIGLGEETGQLSPVDAFFAEVRPFQAIDQSNAFMLGARVELTKLWADKVYLFTLKTPIKMRNRGLAGFALDTLVNAADRHGVILSLDCYSLDIKKGRTTEELKAFYGRRGFVESGAYEMTRYIKQESEQSGVISPSLG